MELPDYEKLLQHLEAAGSIVLACQGDLLAANIRIRHLLSLTTTETKRRLRDLRDASMPAPNGSATAPSAG
jgi:hypothetical protein